MSTAATSGAAEPGGRLQKSRSEESARLKNRRVTNSVELPTASDGFRRLQNLMSSAASSGAEKPGGRLQKSRSEESARLTNLKNSRVTNSVDARGRPTPPKSDVQRGIKRPGGPGGPGGARGVAE